jgi:hypothetical protein
MYRVKENEMQEIKGMLSACQFAINEGAAGLADKKDLDMFAIVLMNFRKKLDVIPYGERG